MNERLKASDRVDTKARGLVNHILVSSLETAEGSHRSAVDLLHLFVPAGPDDGPETRITYELLQAPSLASNEKLALKIGKHFFGDFGREFGYDSQLPVSMENESVNKFMVSMAKAMNGLLNKNGKFANEVMENLSQATEAYQGLTSWADAQLTATG